MFMSSLNRNFKRSVSAAVGSIVSLLLIFSAAGCKNFFNGQDFLSQLEETVSYENAQQCVFTVKADSGTGTFVSDGEKTAKVGFDYFLQFNLNTEDYVLNHWGAFNPDDMSEIADAVEATTISTEEELARGLYKVNIKFLKPLSNVILKPVCFAIPKAIWINTRDETRADGFTQDTDIVIKFNKPIPRDLFIDPTTGDARNIEISCNGRDLLHDISVPSSSFDASFVPMSGYAPIFKKPTLSNDGMKLTIPTDPQKHILRIEGNTDTVETFPIFYYDTYADVSVKLKTYSVGDLGKDSVQGEGVSFTKDIEWNYKVNRKLDNIPPVITEYHIYKTIQNNGDYADEYLYTRFTEWNETQYKNQIITENNFEVLEPGTETYSDRIGCLFFTAYIQETSGIKSEALCTFVDSDDLNKYTFNLFIYENNITKVSDDMFLVKGYIDASNIFDHLNPIPNGVYKVAICFSDFAGNYSNKCEVSVVKVHNNYNSETIKAWNELPNITNNNIENVKNQLDTSVKKIFVSIPKPQFSLTPELSCEANVSGKVYYGHSLDALTNYNLANSAATQIELQKDNERSNTNVLVYYFVFDTLSYTEDNYFRVVFDDYAKEITQDTKQALFDGSVNRIFSVPTNSNIINATKNNNKFVLSFGETNSLIGDYNIRTYTFVENTVPEYVDSNTNNCEITDSNESTQTLVLYGNNYSVEDSNGSPLYLYGLPGNKQLQENTIDSGIPEPIFNVIAEKISGGNNKLKFDIEIEENNQKVSLSALNDSNYSYEVIVSLNNQQYFYTKAPFVLGNLYDTTNNSYYPLDIQLRRKDTNGKYRTSYPEKIKYRLGESIESSLDITNDTIDLNLLKEDSSGILSLDIIPPVVGANGKEYTAFPEFIYITGNTDIGNGFIQNNPSNDDIMNNRFTLDNWDNNWTSYTDYSGDFSQGISTPKTASKGIQPNEIERIGLIFNSDYLNCGKYLIRTVGGVTDKSGNYSNSEIDYFYYGNMNYLQEDLISGISYNISSGVISVNNEPPSTLNLFHLGQKKQQVIPFVDGKWDYSKLMDISTPLNNFFKETFIKCGTSIEYDLAEVNSDRVSFFYLPKYYYINSDGNSISSVNNKTFYKLSDNTLLIMSEYPYLVQTHCTKKTVNAMNISFEVSPTDWEMFTTINNPKLLQGTSLYQVSQFDSDVVYRVIIHWADGTYDTINME